VAAERFTRLLVVLAIAGLRSFGKGANKTPPDCVAFRLPQVECGRSARRRGRAVIGAQPFVVHRAGGVNGQTEEGPKTVTTMSSAEPTRRDFLYIATAAVAGIGAAAALIPLIAQMNPDASTIAAGAPIEVDLTPVAEGQVIKVFWRGKPIFVNHRTKKQIEEAENVDVASLPDPQADSARVKPGHTQWQVLIGICTHLGCIPIAHQGPYDGYFCPCHGSVYDTSGRIRSGPAPSNLALPPYQFLSDTKIRIGEA
jgi:ubiquinol-cytochrome c reductase iron-sulfur subunit